MSEKEQYVIHDGSDHGHNQTIKDIVEQKGEAIGEAADIYGDVQTAEQYGYVERG